MYNPQYRKYQAVQSTWGQRQSDKVLGTNYTGRIDLENRQRAQQAGQENAYEFQKAVNINKYSWNQQGMLSAGINPLAASGSLASLGNASAGQSVGGMDQGDTGEISGAIKDMLHEISPASMIKDIKDIVIDKKKKETATKRENRNFNTNDSTSSNHNYNYNKVVKEIRY